MLESKFYVGIDFPNVILKTHKHKTGILVLVLTKHIEADENVTAIETRKPKAALTACSKHNEERRRTSN